MANTFSIRRAGPADSEAITRVHAASWRTTYQGLVVDAFLDEFFDRGLDDRIASRSQGTARRPDLDRGHPRQSCRGPSAKPDRLGT